MSCATPTGLPAFSQCYKRNSSNILQSRSTLVGKTKLWNQGGVVPSGAAALTAAARISDPDATVWCGDQALPTSEQGIRILGTPLGHPDCVRAELSQLSIKHDALMDKITHVQDLQCAWLLLFYCSAARANYYLRVTHHDASLRRVLCTLLGVDPSFLFWNMASLPLSLGGLGLRSASLLSRAACWASWADSLQMVQQRHPAVSHQILRSLHDPNPHFQLSGLRSSVDFLDDARVCATDLGRSGRRVAPGTRPPWLAEGRH